MKKTNKEYWSDFSKRWKLNRIENDYFLFDIFREYLSIDSSKTVLEVGCNPGNFLIAFNKIFQYQIYGIDYSSMDITYQNMRFNGIKKYNLIQTDFFEFDENKRFDIVSSFGFLEHFEDPYPVIKKMVKHIKAKGFLIVGMPNRRYLNYFLHLVAYGKNNLKTHNLEIMDLKFIKSILDKKLIDLHTSYYNGFKYQINRKSKLKGSLALLLKINALIIGYINTKIDINVGVTHKIFSPYIISIKKLR